MEDRKPKPFVFVLMPFKKELDDLYLLGIKEACKNVGVYCDRLDEEMFDEVILERLYNQIAKADVIVAEMTEKNPNVFYEVGYAHALGKRVILLAKTSKEIPFDLIHHKHIIHRGRITDLKAQLKATLVWALEHPQQPLQAPEDVVIFSIGAVQLSGDPTIKYKTSSPSITQISLKIDAHNPVSKHIRPIEIDIGLLTSRRFPSSHGEKRRPLDIVEPPDESGFLHLPESTRIIRPGAWTSFHIRLDTARGRELFDHDEERMSVRVFTDLGPHDFPFVLHVIFEVKPENIVSKRSKGLGQLPKPGRPRPRS